MIGIWQKDCLKGISGLNIMAMLGKYSNSISGVFLGSPYR